MRALDIKVARDLVRMRSQVIAVVGVIACGVGVFVGMRATMRSLAAARTGYYATERFAHVFARLERAPEQVANKLTRIPGVRQVETRVVADVTLDVEGMTEAATGRLVSLPDRGRPRVNDVRVRDGRLPAPGRGAEVLANEAFIEAHDMPVGAHVGAVINGKRETLRVVGTGLSPEYTYSLGPGLIFPDDRRFGVFWMRREALAAAFEMEGAFNDVSLRLSRDASIEDVIRRTDRVLDPYGGLGAFARRDQQSAFFVDNELRQLDTFAYMLPAIFLAVAAFLLNVVIGRLVATQREEIAAMKAFGYRDGEVGLHYAKLVGLVVFAGAVVGIAVAGSLGLWMTRLYAKYFRFPDLPFALGADEALSGVAIAAVAAAVGTWAAIRRTVLLPPAEAMRPAAPPAYRPTLVERAGLARLVPVAARMVLREVERRPLRAALSIMGIALATGLTVLNAFSFDSIGYLLNVQFGLSRREDVRLTLYEPRSTGALSALEHLPGVLHAEPYRSVPVRLRAATRSRTVAIEGMRADAHLQLLLDARLDRVDLPLEGLVLSRKLAEILGVSSGDRLRVEVLEGRRPVVDVQVARVAETFFGITAYMHIDALCRVLGETETMNSAGLLVDDAYLTKLHSAVKQTPVVAGVTERDALLASARELIDDHIGTWVGISLSFSLMMALGVLYNAARITLAERARELASLRVLGFRRREVAAILSGELALLTIVGIPLGLWIGRLLAAMLVRSPGFNNEQFRLPLVVHPATYGLAVSTVVVAALVSGWSAWRRLERMDIIEVLKTRD